MKRNISDLLNDYPIDEVNFKENTPFSARRIRKMTLNRIERKKTSSFRWISRAAILAAVIAALSVTALAAGVALDEENVIARYFSSFFGDKLTVDQVGVATDIGKVYDDKTYGNGTTITPIAAIADDMMLYLYIHVEAPEHVVLPDCTEDGDYYSVSAYSGTVSYGPYIECLGYPEKTHINGVKVTPMPDENPDDNEKDFVIRMINNGELKFNDGVPKQLRFGSLWFHDKEHEMFPTHVDTTGRCSRIGEGNFAIDIDCGYEGAKIEVDTGAVTYRDAEYDFTTIIQKVTITPLHIEVECTRTNCEAEYIFPRGGPVQLVMKDGTVIQALDAYFDANAQTEFHPDSIAGICTFDWFDELIVLENIDHIIVGDGEIFDVN